MYVCMSVLQAHICPHWYAMAMKTRCAYTCYVCMYVCMYECMCCKCLSASNLYAMEGVHIHAMYVCMYIHASAHTYAGILEYAGNRHNACFSTQNFKHFSHDLTTNFYQVVPFDEGLNTFKKLSSLGLQAKFRGFPGVRHAVNQEIFDEISRFLVACAPPPVFGA